MIVQLHMPNPRVNRKDRKRILSKRIRGLARIIGLLPNDIRTKRLEDYRAELRTL